MSDAVRLEMFAAIDGTVRLERGMMKAYYEQDGISIYHGSALSLPLADGSMRCCVTSPPYWGLRDYMCEGQIGLEPTPELYVASLVAVFREVRRVLTDDGTIWVNLGDSYASHGAGGMGKHLDWLGDEIVERKKKLPAPGLKPKDLVGIPWRVAFALQADGWYLRSDIIWHKPNPMPESVTDRPTKAHEYIFLLSKSDRYYYDQAAILDPVSPGTHARLSQDLMNQIGSHRANGGGKTNGPMKALGRKAEQGVVGVVKHNASFDASVCMPVTERNKRTVWTVPTQSFKGAHFATYPPALIEPCILAGSAPGDTVLDPFNGSGTTGAVCQTWGRRYVGMELNASYIELSKERFRQRPLFPVEARPT